MNHEKKKRPKTEKEKGATTCSMLDPFFLLWEKIGARKRRDPSTRAPKKTKKKMEKTKKETGDMKNEKLPTERTKKTVQQK